MSQSCCIHLLLLCLCFSLTGCGNKGPLETAKPVPSPAQISSSEQVVKVTASPVSIPENGSADANLTLSISPGFHINANPASFPYLIATRVGYSGQIDPNGNWPIMSAPIYPRAVNKRFAFAEEPLAVYEGEAMVVLPLRNTRHAKKGSTLSLPIGVRVQACDEEKCYPPATVNVSIPVNVN